MLAEKCHGYLNIFPFIIKGILISPFIFFSSLQFSLEVILGAA